MRRAEGEEVNSFVAPECLGVLLGDAVASATTLTDKIAFKSLNFFHRLFIKVSFFLIYSLFRSADAFPPYVFDGLLRSSNNPSNYDKCT
jgi:hypothetical protein